MLLAGPTGSDQETADGEEDADCGRPHGDADQSVQRLGFVGVTRERPAVRDKNKRRGDEPQQVEIVVASFTKKSYCPHTRYFEGCPGRGVTATHPGVNFGERGQ